MERGADCSEAERLGTAIRDRAAALHAATAELVALIDSFDAIEGWQGAGLRSLPHWLSIEAGFDLGTARRLSDLGEAVRALPLTAAEFAAGRLSADKVHLVAKVARPEDEAVWVETALNASGAQLRRIVRDVTRVRRADDVPAGEQTKRGLWWHF